jgi:His-Xaa-Ser system radical SAM maturase HxsB
MKETILDRIDAESTGFFRFRQLGGKYLLTNDCGSWELLSPPDFEKFVAGKLPRTGKIYAALQSKGFVRNNTDFDGLIGRWAQRNDFLKFGPSLHIVVVTLRCDHACVYCQTSAHRSQDKSLDMTPATAKKVVDCIFAGPSPLVTIEFQGGEPLLNWPAVKTVVEHARKKEKQTGKKAIINLVSNMANMTGERFDFLHAQGVNFCTSIDGPEKIHNRNRVYTEGNSHACATGWFKKIQEKTSGQLYQADALLTVSRATLENWKAVIDEYESMGARGISLRFLSPMGMAVETWSKIGYTPDEFLAFYEKSLDYILEINRKKRTFFENSAVLFLLKILSDSDPNFMDLRSPCGGAVGQIAYNYDGKVFTCDEARMLNEMGDDSFCIGDIAKDSYSDIINKPAVKCLVTASCTDLQPACSQCAYKPYCGVCPVINYASEHDLFARMPCNSRCKLYKGMLDMLFTRLDRPDDKKVFSEWVRLALRKLQSEASGTTEVR